MVALAALDNARNRRWKRVAAGVLLVGLVATVYAPATRNGYIWDDDAYVQNNRVLREGTGLLRIWSDPQSIPQWYPLVHTTFWVEYQLWGLHPLGYHVDNLLLHLVSRPIADDRRIAEDDELAKWALGLGPIAIQHREPTLGDVCDVEVDRGFRRNRSADDS